MSDGISEARKGTYFMDRSKPQPTEKERLEHRKRILESQISDYRFELEDINDQLKKMK
jgi:hypothetical protein